jgi:hypothetical protein
MGVSKTISTLPGIQHLLYTLLVIFFKTGGIIKENAADGG